jgi:hypothetical protein
MQGIFLEGRGNPLGFLPGKDSIMRKVKLYWLSILPSPFDFFLCNRGKVLLGVVPCNGSQKPDIVRLNQEMSIQGPRYRLRPARFPYQNM